MNKNDWQLLVPIPLDRIDDAEFVKFHIRGAKKQLLDKLMDEAWHGRYWIIRIDEKPPESWEIDQADFNFERVVYYRLKLYISEVASADHQMYDITRAMDDYFHLPRWELRKQKKGFIQRILHHVWKPD